MTTIEIPFDIEQRVWRVTCKEEYEPCGYCHGQKYFKSMFYGEGKLPCPGCNALGHRGKNKSMEHVVDGPWRVLKVEVYGTADNRSFWCHITRNRRNDDGDSVHETGMVSAGLLHATMLEAQDHADSVNLRFVPAQEAS